MSQRFDQLTENDATKFLAAGGEMGERTRAFDWSKTPLGPVENWPQSLKIAVRIMLGSRYAMWLGWGPELTFFYNDAYARMTLGPKHPWALGRPAREVWSEIWEAIGPRAEAVVRTGQATWDEGLLLFLERRGFSEETYHTFSYSPIPDDGGGIGGMLCVVTEDTERTIGERRLRTLRELAARTAEVSNSVEAACQAAARTLARNKRDLPFVLIYLLDANTDAARLAGVTGLAEDSAAAPRRIDISGNEVGWPLHAALESGRIEIVTDLGKRFGPLSAGEWPEPVREAVVLPVTNPGQNRPAGFVVVGTSPRLMFNDDYRGFLDLLASQIGTAVNNARAYDEERRRAEALAELDRAKTAFFSNVSHEFRTPLTLMLGTVEDLLARSHTDLSPAAASQLEVVSRNGLRLLRLVNTLLDFSRIEAGRVRAAYQPTDLSAFTTELASVFRAAVERAGLRLVVDCPQLAEPVFVDRDMWEKIVLNLLSNAFKFTFEGEIEVRLRQAGSSALLVIRDTGTGIPAEDLPKLFERFHRVENARGRTHEGSGIGLALVQELVKLHGGSITAESDVEKGTAFTVSVPLGSAHLPPDQIEKGRSPASTVTGAMPYVEEAMRWLPDEVQDELVGRAELPAYYEPLPLPHPGTSHDEADNRPRILVVDDNADMRQYVVRLLAEHYRVDAAPDGEAALQAARERSPDLVLTDVMMPRLDGFGLLRELRGDPQTSRIPVIMLSARAGEESRVEGLEAGADDYVVKPFSARELLARVTAHLQMARMRQEASASLAEAATANVKFRAFFEQGALFAGIMDVDGTIIEPNRLSWEACGFTREQIIGKPFWKCPWWTPSADLMEEIRAASAKAARGETFRAEMPYFVADGSERMVDIIIHPIKDETGQIVFLAPTGTDITDRVRAQQALRESEARYRAIGEAIDFGVWMCDARGRNTYVSESFLRLIGVTQERCSDFGWGDVLHPDEAGKTIAAWKECIRTGGVWDREQRVKGIDGRWHYVLARGVPMKNDEGRILGWVGIHLDISRLKQAEQALREADRRKDEFLATLAHELRNPLAPVRNATQILNVKGGDSPELRWATDVIDRQMQAMTRLIDDLMDVSRISRNKLELRKEQVELAKVLAGAVETSRPIIEQERHELAIKLPHEPVIVDADVTRLTQVFLNLLNNAAKYTERGGRIELSAEREGRDVVVSVTDTGIGIPADKLPTIFEMFSQVEGAVSRSQGGLGIGLSLVKRLVEMHGGLVEAASAGPGRGSRFSVRLPMIAGDSQLPLSSTGPEGGAATSQLRILVVDDNRDAALTMAMLLKITGNQVRTAHDGEEAVQAAGEFRPGVVLLDIGLPKRDGYDVARCIRREPWGKDMVLIALTGWGQDGDKLRAHDAGFDNHLVKPVDPQSLMAIMAGLQTARSQS